AVRRSSRRTAGGARAETVPAVAAEEASALTRRMSLEQMIVLGIDPGTASTGYGVVHGEGSRLRALASGVIRTRAGLALERRLVEVHGRIGELLDRFGPEAIAVEELYFGANVQTAFAVGQARGVALLAAGERG